VVVLDMTYASYAAFGAVGVGFTFNTVLKTMMN
jgi:hypothetical protein